MVMLVIMGNFLSQSCSRQYMTLDKDIKNTIETTIENDLAAPKVPKKRVPNLKRIWKCEYAYDFLYGHRVGYYKGLAEGFVLERYRRQLTEAEDNEVFEIVEPYTRALRNYFAYYKTKPTARKPSHKQ
ncbi:MAG TPA: hypothetical protein VGQ13_06770 [Nitrososphaera sp.]|jgi:hypothetical protein|nr:hypothetical protein [Nitrososphaera sp.]